MLTKDEHDLHEQYENLSQQARDAIDDAYKAATDALKDAGLTIKGDDRAEKLVAAITEYVLLTNTELAVPGSSRYKGKYLGTISKTWPQKSPRHGTSYWAVREAMGTITERDYGKMVFEIDGVIQVENDEQRDKRVSA
jgi:hypothetical protein